MSMPTVCAIMLTRDRPAMTARAVESFRRQTYENKDLLILDSGGEGESFDDDAADIWHAWHPEFAMKTIGELRNQAIAMGGVASELDIIAHFDSDDLSHPNRLAEQVALLQSSGADCVGYNEMIFWQSPATVENWKERAASGESQIGLAWLYSNHIPPNYVLGTSLCYWRKAWEAHPFDDINQGEDMRFVGKVKTVGVSALSVGMDGTSRGCARCFSIPCMCEPRMIAAIHGNQSSRYDPAGKPNNFRRVPEWDNWCAERMKL